MNAAFLHGREIKINRNGKILGAIKQFFIKENEVPAQMPDGETIQLLNEVNKARADWMSACRSYEYAQDQSMIDYCIYNMKACQIKYEYLLRLAKQEGLKVDGLEKNQRIEIEI